MLADPLGLSKLACESVVVIVCFLDSEGECTYVVGMDVWYVLVDVCILYVRHTYDCLFLGLL